MWSCGQYDSTVCIRISVIERMSYKLLIAVNIALLYCNTVVAQECEGYNYDEPCLDSSNSEGIIIILVIN